jgi:hypothetical protein
MKQLQGFIEKISKDRSVLNRYYCTQWTKKSKSLLRNAWRWGWGWGATVTVLYKYRSHKYLTLKTQWTTTTSILIYQYHEFLMRHHIICIRGHRQKLNIRTDHQVIKSIILFNQCIHFAIGLADISPIEELIEWIMFNQRSTSSGSKAV